MTNRHQKQSLTPEEIRARKIKLAEGGILFALVVGLCIFLGVHFARDGGDEPVAARITAPDQPPAPVAVRAEPATAPAPVEAADDGTEPVAVAEGSSEAEAAADEPLPIREILPEVPVYVTYSSAEKTFFEGRYAEAADMFARYCEDHPENVWGRYMHGLSLWKADRDEAAADAFGQALDLAPDHLKSLVNLARVQLELGQAERALVSVEQALDVAPANVDARRVLGRAYHELGRLDEAADAYVEALRLRADDAWSLNNLALIRIEQEAFARALPALARAVELAPEEAVIRNNLGTALEAAGHLSQALEQFTLAADLGSGKGELSLARLEAVVVPEGEPMADLDALAASWSVPADVTDPAAPAGEATSETVAAVTPATDAPEAE